MNQCKPVLALLIGIAAVTSTQVTSTQGAEFSIKQESSGDIAIHIDGQLFTRYVTTDKVTNKCYFWPIVGPGGMKMTRAHPLQDIEGEKQDHPHHRSVCFGLQSAGGFNTWHEVLTFTKNGKVDPHRAASLGRQVHTKVIKAEASGNSATLVVECDNVNPKGEIYMRQTRTVDFQVADNGSRMMDIAIVLKGVKDNITIDGKKDSGLTVRVAHSMCVDAGQGGRIVNSNGDIDGDAWGERCEWVDFNGPVEGKTMGIAMLNHPDSFRHPTPWHVRNYGLFTANPFALKEDGKTRWFRAGYENVQRDGNAMSPGLRPELGGRANVLATHPLSTTVPCVLSRSITIPSEGETTLLLETAHDPRGDWTLVVKADGEELLKQEVSEATADHVWRTIRVDLSPFAGKTVKIEVENRASNWKYEAAFWSRIALENRKRRGNKPNVVLFLVDDMGWSDLACYGSPFYETPNIDRLAGEGVRFTDAYATCHVCSPSRASVLTGKYPARLDLTDWLSGRREFPFQRLKNAPIHQALPLKEITLAESLSRHGYRTGHFGKWHLGEHPAGPLQQGFDVQVPTNWYKGWPKAGYHAPFELDGIDDQQGDYLTDRLTDEALTFIGDNSDEPFFLYLSHFAVHDPIQGRADLVAKYEHKRSQLPTDEEPFVLEGNPDAKISFTRVQRDAMIDDPAYADYRVLPNQMVKIKQRQDNPQFAAMVETVDESLGRIVTKLKSLGLEENTIIILTSDNGGMSGANFGHPARVVHPSKIDAAYSTSNLPLRGAKGWLYEGGIRVPLIIKWPGHGVAGSICDEPVIGVDYYPTILDMIGVGDLPEQHADGESLCPLFHGAATLDREALYWHFPHYSNHGMQSPGGAIRSGRYKLLEYFENGTVQLFDLEADPGEQNDLSQTHPEIVAQLLDRLHRWREDVDAKMMGPNPDFDASTAAEQ